MPRFTRIVVVVYLLFNVAIAATLIVDPSQLDAQYRGGPMTPTREFLWFSVASMHLFLVAATAATLRMRRAAERRWIVLANAGFYLWDAATQWAYWGAYVGLAAGDLHVNAGVSAGCGLLLVAAAWRDRDEA
jgi:hypothetical protein